MEKVTFLGPVGATFSHDAYNILSRIYYEAPGAITEGNYANCVPASSNGEILKLILEHSGYGAIAMETLAEGRVAEPLESFINLLEVYKKTDGCPLHVIGAIRLRLHFCLMVRGGMPFSNTMTTLIAHPKALGACKKHIASRRLRTMNASSSGEAARLVATLPDKQHVIENKPSFAAYAALGPKSAAEKYGLNVLDEAFEDGEAVTTFFLLGPKEHKVSVGKENRALIVFAVPHKPGGLVRSLIPFEQEGLNLIQIHSVHVGNHTYNFAIEVEVGESQLESFERAMKKLWQSCQRIHILRTVRSP